MGLASDVQRAASDYMMYIIYGLVVIFAFFAIDAAFRGMGDTKTPLKIVSVGLTFNIILDPFLIFGIGPFPRLEAGGAALATILSHLLILVWGTALLQRRSVRLVYDRRKQGFLELGLLWRIVKIGAPIAFSGFMFSVSYMFLTRVITQFGSDALAALGLGHRIEGLAFFASLGFSVAAATLVGQNLGADKPDRAEKAAWLTLFYISVLLIVVSLIFYLFARQIMALFIRDTEVIEEGVRYLRTIAFFEVFLGSEVVLEGAFGGAGNSIPPMVVSVPLTWARIPLALFLAHELGLGSSGVWWAIAVTTGLKGVIMAFWFKKNRWKLKEV